jgi:hypothetical protein
MEFEPVKIQPIPRQQHEADKEGASEEVRGHVPANTLHHFAQSSQFTTAKGGQHREYITHVPAAQPVS